MKKLLFAVLISSSILAGVSIVTANAMNPSIKQTTTEQTDDKSENSIDATASDDELEEDDDDKSESSIHPVIPDDKLEDDDYKTAEPAAVVSDSTAEETAPETVDMLISPELREQTLKKFSKLSCNLEPMKEYKTISQLHILEEFGNPDSNDALKTLTLFHAPNPEYMPKLEGLSIISATGVPFINASCVPSRADSRYILAANPAKGLVEWRGNSINTYPEYIKLLL